eukprot:2720009-Amphidinium_carterae.1
MHHDRHANGFLAYKNSFIGVRKHPTTKQLFRSEDQGQHTQIPTLLCLDMLCNPAIIDLPRHSKYRHFRALMVAVSVTTRTHFYTMPNAKILNAREETLIV